jgi:excisionase family DNA binding protein
VSGIDLHLSDAALDQLADLLAARVAARLGSGSASPWLNARDAAAYIGAPLSRVRKLTMTGEMPAHRDGRRVLYRREDLDAYIARGGARSA